MTRNEKLVREKEREAEQDLFTLGFFRRPLLGGLLFSLCCDRIALSLSRNRGAGRVSLTQVLLLSATFFEQPAAFNNLSDFSN